MVPDKFNMVDMEGIDIIESQGETVAGLYQKLVESITQCRYQCLYNWKFDGISIPPTYVEMEIVDDKVWINEGVSVDEEDVVHVYSLEIPVPPSIEPLTAIENGEYEAPSGVDGFNPVTVNVPPSQPVIESKSITANGEYRAPTGVDGYNPITVNVPSQSPVIESKSITANGEYIAPTGVDGYNPITVNVPSSAPLIANWDFRNSLIDTIHGVSITLSGATRDSNGLHLASGSSYATLPAAIRGCRTFEIEIGSCSRVGSNHSRFFLYDSDSGFIYRSTGKWSFYATSQWGADSSISDPNFFANSIMKVEVLPTGIWKIYKDNVLVYQTSIPQYSYNYNYRIGSNANSFYNVDILSLKVY